MATTTNYGWETPDDTDLVKDGALAARTTANSVDSTLFTALGGNYPGLRLVKKQTIGSGVSSVSITSAFSATYANYKIIVDFASTSGSAGGVIQLNNDTSSVYYSTGWFMGWGSSTLSTFGGVITTNWPTTLNTANATPSSFEMDVINPFNSARTYMTLASQAGNGNGYVNGMTTSTNSNTGFTLSKGGDTMTGGTIYVYGYGAS